MCVCESVASKADNGKNLLAEKLRTVNCFYFAREQSVNLVLSFVRNNANILVANKYMSRRNKVRIEEQSICVIRVTYLFISLLLFICPYEH